VTGLTSFGRRKEIEASALISSDLKSRQRVRLVGFVTGHGSTNAKLANLNGRRNELSSFRD
jgi:hypothetical protein